MLNFYQVIISLDRCNGGYNTVDNLPAKICVPNRTKDIKRTKRKGFLRWNKKHFSVFEGLSFCGKIKNKQALKYLIW